jgi:hypothetical protein
MRDSCGDVSAIESSQAVGAFLDLKMRLPFHEGQGFADRVPVKSEAAARLEDCQACAESRSSAYSGDKCSELNSAGDARDNPRRTDRNNTFSWNQERHAGHRDILDDLSLETEPSVNQFLENLLSRQNLSRRLNATTLF